MEAGQLSLQPCSEPWAFRCWHCIWLSSPRVESLSTSAVWREESYPYSFFCDLLAFFFFSLFSAILTGTVVQFHRRLTVPWCWVTVQCSWIFSGTKAGHCNLQLILYSPLLSWHVQVKPEREIECDLCAPHQDASVADAYSVEGNTWQIMCLLPFNCCCQEGVVTREATATTNRVLVFPV